MATLSTSITGLGKRTGGAAQMEYILTFLCFRICVASMCALLVHLSNNVTHTCERRESKQTNKKKNPQTNTGANTPGLRKSPGANSL